MTDRVLVRSGVPVPATVQPSQPTISEIPMADHRSHWLIPRRTFLRGLGTALALPLLDCMADAAEPQARVAEAMPRRCAFIYFPNGCNVHQWFPQDDGAAYTMSPTLKLLEPLRQDLTIFSGLHHPNASNGHEVGENWLTAVDPHSTPGFNFRNSISIDQVIAAEVGSATRFRSLELTTDGGGLAWNSLGVQLPAENSPANVFKRFFTNEAGGVAEADKRIRQGQSLLDTVLASAKDLERRLGQNDRRKLGEYLDSVRVLEQDIEHARKWAHIPKPKADGAPFRGGYEPNKVRDYLRNMYDLMVLALRTDSTRIITFMSHRESSGFTITEAGLSQDQHSLTHHQDDPARLEKTATADRFLVEQFAYFLDQLKKTKEGERSLLDTTMVMYGSGASNTHIHFHLPILFAGGGALGIGHGRHIDFAKTGTVQSTTDRRTGEGVAWGNVRVNPDARLSNLLLTMAHGMGVKLPSFVDSLGPIRDVLPA